MYTYYECDANLQPLAMLVGECRPIRETWPLGSESTEPLLLFTKTKAMYTPGYCVLGSRSSLCTLTCHRQRKVGNEIQSGIKRGGRGGGWWSRCGVLGPVASGQPVHRYENATLRQLDLTVPTVYHHHSII